MSFDLWKKTRLGDIADVVMGQSPESKYYNNTGEGLPFLQGNRTFGYKHPSFDTYCTNGNRFANPDDVLLSVRAPVGDLNITKERVCIGRGLASLCMKNGNNEYLYYLLKANIDELINRESGTVYGSINRNDIINFEVLVIDSDEKQLKISDILSTLDDKIELNRQTNATLEAIAQAIFKEWFVDFNYPGATGEMVKSELGLIPKGWHVVPIGDLFGFVIGGDWGFEKQQNEDDVLCSVIRGTDFENLSKGIVESVPHRFIKHKSFQKRCLREGDIIFEISGGSKTQATGRNIWVSSEILDLFDFPVVPTSFCRLIRPGDIGISVYLGIFLSSFYKAGATWDYQLQSTGISNFQFVDFSTRLKIVVPDKLTLQTFEKIAYSLLSLQAANAKNNKSLISSLNLLLSRFFNNSHECLETQI